MDFPDFGDGPVYPPVTEVEVCGNGVLDDGEECDDGNRLDGDGCDWLCRIGDGAPPPAPDPTVPDYVPDGDPHPLPDSEAHSVSPERLPLVWTGDEYATAYAILPETPTDSPWIEFRRFDATGRTLDAPWRYSSPAFYGGLELVWTGTRFALFYVDMRIGIFYMQLDWDGKPLTEPILVEPDPRARSPAADVTADGFVLAWVRESGGADGWSWCSVDGAPDQIRVTKVGLDGTVRAAPVTVDETAQGPPDVAAGDGGFGLTMPVELGRAGSCNVRFVRLDESLASPVYSGLIAPAGDGDVKWLDGRYVTALAHYWEPAGGPAHSDVVVSWFAASGELEGPPVRNAVGDAFLGSVLRIAAGDGGLALVGAWDSDQQLSFLRTDMAGVAVGPVRPVVDWATGFPPGAWFGSCNTVWADRRFGVLFEGLDFGDPGRTSGLYLQAFVAE